MKTFKEFFSDSLNERVKMQKIAPDFGKVDGKYKGELKTAHKVGDSVYTHGASNDEDETPFNKASVSGGTVVGIGANHIKIKHADGKVKQFPPESVHLTRRAAEDAYQPSKKIDKTLSINSRTN